MDTFTTNEVALLVRISKNTKIALYKSVQIYVIPIGNVLDLNMGLITAHPTRIIKLEIVSFKVAQIMRIAPNLISISI